MTTLKEIFNLFDVDNDGFIDLNSFKRVVNIIGLPLENIDASKTNFNMFDLHEYIIDNKEIDKVNKNLLKKKLNENCICHDKQFIIDKLESNKNINIDIDKLKLIREMFLNE